MPVCTVCGEKLPADRKVCDVCGTTVSSNLPPSGGESRSGPSQTLTLVPPSAGPRPAPATGGKRVCSLCHTVYGTEYDDEFCRCGGELVAATDLPPEPESPDRSDSSAVQPDVRSPEPAETAGDGPQPAGGSGTATGKSGPVRPLAGTDCLVVYSEQKEPIHYCAIDKDVTVIGRSDPVRGDFPDLDLGELFDQATARKISRKHALVLRLRDSHTYLIRPLGGSTGTQIEREMAEPLHDYPLTVGTRLVLGGTVRLKFEKIT
jgi:hypothetical protein